MEDTDRRRRGGGDGGRAAVAARRLAVCLRGRVQGHGVLGDPALPAVVLRRERVRRRKFGGNAILWGGWVLGGGVRLGHGFWGVGGLLVTLATRTRQSFDQCLKCPANPASRRGNGHHITPPLGLEESLITANEHSLRLGGGGGDTRGDRSGTRGKAQEERSIN